MKRTNALCLLFATLFALSLSSHAQEHKLTGVVVDANTQQPVPYALVTLAENGSSVTADEQGRFAFGKVPEHYSLITVQAPDYFPLSTQLTPAGAGADVTLAMTARVSVMERVLVSATGEPQLVRDTTRSVGLVDQQQVDATRQVGLDEMMNSIPGVKAENQTDSEQVRISIRGRDTRNSFGLIGIKLLIDGIPESDASGETPDLTGIDLANAENIEVVKGPISARYGVGSAGVVNILTRDGVGTSLLDVENYGGSYGFVRNQLAFSRGDKNLAYIVDGSRVDEDGYRDHSSYFLYRAGGRVSKQLTHSLNCNLLTRFSHGEDQLPGALTAGELASDRNQVSFQYGEYNANEDIMRVMGAAGCQLALPADQSLNASVFSRVLDYGLAVPFIYEKGHRPETGAGGNYKIALKTGFLRHNIIAGAYYQGETDGLNEFANNSGVPGYQYTEQVRTVHNEYGYVLDQVDVGKKLVVNGGFNYGTVNFNVDDKLGSGSGQKRFSRPTFDVGTAYHFSPEISVYGTISTGFESPTLTELGRALSGFSGINSTLQAEKSLSLELGTWVNFRQREYLNVAIFRSPVSNEIVPTGLGYPQQTYDNAAKTLHNGAEVGTGGVIVRGLNWNAAYTYSNFYYQQYVNSLGVNSAGKQIPALPRNHVYASVDYRAFRGARINGQVEGVGHMFASDANTAGAGSYVTAQLFGSYEKNVTEKVMLRFKVGVRNISNGLYSAYIVPNDEYGSYYYPAPQRNYFGSLDVRWNPPGIR